MEIKVKKSLMSSFEAYDCNEKLRKNRDNNPVDSNVHPDMSSTGEGICLTLMETYCWTCVQELEIKMNTLTFFLKDHIYSKMYNSSGKTWRQF